MVIFRPPCYSLGARLAGAGKASRTPGPAAYPPNLYNTKKVCIYLSAISYITNVYAFTELRVALLFQLVLSKNM